MKMRTFRILSISFLIAFLLIPASAIFAATGKAFPTCLRCEYRQDPFGIDVAKPRLSWVLEASQRGQKQTACQVLVASSPELLAKNQGDLWDSGEVQSDQTTQVEYAGKPLESQARCYWKVRVWDRDGAPSRWSKSAKWSMGLLKPDDWKAKWIGYDAAYQALGEITKDGLQVPAQNLKWVRYPEKGTKSTPFTVYLRKDFNLPPDQKIRSAVLDLYAFNHCTASLNNVAIGEAMQWEATSHLDATAALRPGTNTLGLIASNSDFLFTAIIGKLVVRFESGKDLTIPIDRTWKTSKEFTAGWDKKGFDDKAWVAAEELKGQPNGASEAEIPRVPAPYLRKEFQISQKVKRATIFVTALGIYELRLNGMRVGTDVFAPGWTNFHKRVQYYTYDVTSQVRRGANAIGAILGDGWYASNLAYKAQRNLYGGKPRLLAQMVVEMADGSTQIIVTDNSWKASYGPILHADLLIGCEYDARRAMPGWDKTGFNDRAWRPVEENKSSPGNDGLIIEAANAEPSRPIEEIRVVKVTQPKSGCWTFDLGQNMVGWVRIKAHGPADSA